MNKARSSLPLIYALACWIVIGCGSGGGGLGDPGLSNIQVEVGNARAATITQADGGTITATGSNGFVYTLTIPPNAVLADTQVAIYPIKAIKNLPTGATLYGGVNFSPDGLQLQAPATLTIQVPSSVDPKKAVPIAYSGNGGHLHFDLGIVNGRTITTKVYHFSGTALGGRDVLDLIRTDPLVSNTTTDFQSRMSRLFETGEYSAAQYLLILRNWYALVVKPALIRGAQQSSTIGVQAQGEIEYYAWLDAILFARITLLDDSFSPNPELAESEPLAIALIKREYAFYNDLCVTNKNNALGSGSRDIDPLLDAELAMSYAGSLADDWHIARAPNGLDKETLLNSLCVKVVIETKSYSGTAPGQSGNLSVKAGFTIAGGAVRHDFPIQVKISGNGQSTPASGNIVNGANFNSVVNWPTGVNPLTINILASLFKQSPVGNSNQLKDVAVFDRITKTASNGGGGGGGGGGIFGQYDGTVTDLSSSPGPGGRARIYLTQQGNLVGVEIQEGNVGPPKGPTFKATLSGSSLHFADSDTVFDATVTGTHMTATEHDPPGTPNPDRFDYDVTRTGP